MAPPEQALRLLPRTLFMLVFRTFNCGLLAAISVIGLYAQVDPWDPLTALSIPTSSDDLAGVNSYWRPTRPQVVSLTQLRRQRDPQLLEAFRQASKFVRAEHHVDAASAFARIVESAPDYSDARHEWALELAAVGDLDGAIREFKNVMQADPDYALAYTNLAVILYQHRRYSEAEVVVRKGITRLGAWPKASLVLAQSWWLNGNGPTKLDLAWNAPKAAMGSQGSCLEYGLGLGRLLLERLEGTERRQS